MKTIQNTILHLISLSLLCTPTTGWAHPPSAELDDLAEDVGFHRFADLMRQTGLADELRSHLGEVTILVPRIEAFDVFVEDPSTPTQDQLALIHGLLEQHVVEGRFTPPTVIQGVRSVLLPEVELTPGRAGQLVNVNGATTMTTGRFWTGRNGNIVEVTKVIAPALSLDHYLAEGGFELFREALVATDTTKVSHWAFKATVLAAGDEAFLRVGLDKNAIHDPANLARVTAIVNAHVLAIDALETLFDGGLQALSGALVRAERVYDPVEQREREGVFHDGVLRVWLHEGYAPSEFEVGVIWVTEGLIDLKN